MNQAPSNTVADREAAPPAPTFDALPLGADIRKAVDALGYLHPTPVQLAVFEPATRGRSLVVQARTGTGKTAAFGLPIVDTLVKRSTPGVQALILTPTRELALQVAGELGRLSQFRGTNVVAIYGGAPMGRQIAELEGGAHIVVGTPGRVLDHLRRGTLDASSIRIFVLDEADEMLSMGFQKELNAIIENLPTDRQGLYFSATIPPDVERLANSHLRDPEYVTLSSDQIGALEISHFVYLMREGDKRAALARIIEVEDPESAVIFCNTKDETERVAEALKSRGYEADWLNGDLEQRERERVMAATREGRLRFLVATDVAARGIDISHLTHVINADFPESAEQYVHRTGRTGRAGRTGVAISMVGPKDVGHLYMLRLTYKIRPIERMLPTAGELRTRAESDMIAFLADAYAGKAHDGQHLALARRLLTHDSAEFVIAGLLADHLGASAGTTAQDAADARRAKNPPPVHNAAPRADTRPSTRPDTRPDAQPETRREARSEARSEAVRETRRERPNRPRPARSSDSDGAAPRERFDSRLPQFKVEDAPPSPNRSKPPADTDPTKSPNESSREQGNIDPTAFTNVFLNVGRRDGLSVRDVEQLLADKAGLQSDDIGHVRLRDRITFVEIRKEHSDRVIKALVGAIIGDRTLNAEPARDG
jgi:ATP-dependent RNA helicase DeaD